jgi:hypothetical protein
VYSWTANKRGDTPIANTILTLAAVHFFQFLTLVLVIDRLIMPMTWVQAVFGMNKAVLLILALGYFILFYFAVYNKKRWEKYVSNYVNENDLQRRRGNMLVLSYLIGSILLFFVSLPLLFTIGKHLHSQ